jgi:hypothetical protein
MRDLKEMSDVEIVSKLVDLIVIFEYLYRVTNSKHVTFYVRLSQGRVYTGK